MTGEEATLDLATRYEELATRAFILRTDLARGKTLTPKEMDEFLIVIKNMSQEVATFLRAIISVYRDNK